ncbi:CRISPR-associated helicase Cas3' [Caballeronia sp. LZ062]|uniref:CRISPR-associated helicase Cas3' n=1 Tax=unclassified Caballeronia TaxID=2646786 RepID=UPI0028646051|nr:MULTISPECIES: CRISPR-associated helicase Cas3' [unclassified Caballeronia]MDR5857060.1 CRISPR-associated helicase Cas3' [Caballeronia sp. LZ050]MDR5869544.1 CRISPR-associated helicase Cas3' [Caballeronia sp. LZ062]
MEPQAQQLEPWGKLSRTAVDCIGERSMHPLYDHMMDVAACFLAALKEGTRLRTAFDTVAGRVLGQQDIERLAVFACLHDLGKANSGFQAKRWQGNAPTGWPSPAGHGVEVFLLFCDDELASCLPLDSIKTWGPGADSLLLASLSHHGRPLPMPHGQDPIIWKPVRDRAGSVIYSPKEAIRNIGERLQRDFACAFDPDGKPLPSTPAFVHLFAGVMQFADWLGSHPGFFPFSDPGTRRTRAEAEERATRAVSTIGLDACTTRIRFVQRPLSFESAFEGKAPRPVQAALGDPALGPLLILESETGSGKTEAALWRFARLFAEHKVDSLYFALPTRVAAAQVYERVLKFVRNLWPLDAPVVVRTLPGYESADGSDKIALPDFNVQWSDHPDDAKAATRWAAESPKRFLAATIAVGTIDQVLLAGLMVRHAHMRHALLSRSLLVVDEVHASDIYMSQLLEQVLSAHVGTGGHALLLSATLGSRQRTRCQQIAQRSAAALALPSVEQACALPYPALTDGANIRSLTASGASKTVHWSTLDAMDDHERIARLAIDAASRGARVLIVRNTVPSAVATQQAIERLIDGSGDRGILFDLNGVVTLHHSRFSRQDRPLLDAAVESRLGKIRAALKGCIVVGTQTLEQSLDIDADLLITDICPMDVLLQRIGRLHRHQRDAHERPEGFQHAHAWVLTPAGNSFETYIHKPRNGLGRSKNGGGVYRDLRMIEATRRLIEEAPFRVIPRDNRLLVERATHPDCLLAIQSELGPAWEKLGQQLEGGQGAERSLARMHSLDYKTPFLDLLFPDDERRLTTRLGMEDRLIEFDPPVPGPFGIDVQRIALRHHMLDDDVDPDAKPSGIGLIEHGFEFTLGTNVFRYGRFGVERLNA